MTELDYMIIDSLHGITIRWEADEIHTDTYVRFVEAAAKHLTIDLRHELTRWLALPDNERYLLTDRIEPWLEEDYENY